MNMKEIFEALHPLLGQALIDQLQDAVSSGEPINPALLNQARQFLKDNDQVGSSEDGSVLKNLANELTDFDQEDTPLRLAKKA